MRSPQQKQPEVNGFWGKKHQKSQSLCFAASNPGLCSLSFLPGHSSSTPSSVSVPELPASLEGRSCCPAKVSPRSTQGMVHCWHHTVLASQRCVPSWGQHCFSGWQLRRKTMQCSRTWVSCCHRTTLRGNHLFQADAWPLSRPSHPCSSPWHSERSWKELSIRGRAAIFGALTCPSVAGGKGS